MSKGALMCILLHRCLQIEPRLRFESEDHMLTAMWPLSRLGNCMTFTSIVAFDVADAVKLLKHVLARLDERTRHGA